MIHHIELNQRNSTSISTLDIELNLYIRNLLIIGLNNKTREFRQDHVMTPISVKKPK